MSWRLRIEHRTGFRYAAPVTASYNEARLSPLTDPRQLALDARVTTTPITSVQRYWDYWGTLVSAFDVHQPHEELVVTATSVVETSAAEPVPDETSWADLADDAVYDEFAELLAPTAYVPTNAELAVVARDIASDSSRPIHAVNNVVAWVDEELRYQQGTTGVHTSAVEAWKAGEGVCQDFAHLTLVLLRAIGIPCRYLSGYLYPAADAVPGDVGVGESHAWVEVWTGDWWACDPTNGALVGERHVLVGRGRDYADVAPLRGIYTGGGSSGLGVTVEIERLR
jgi:transglutaminase-like putative cysteine protease